MEAGGEKQVSKVFLVKCVEIWYFILPACGNGKSAALPSILGQKRLWGMRNGWMAAQGMKTEGMTERRTDSESVKRAGCIV
ncbi:MAG TPA: hypothetical protein DCZ91_18805 [Lachnospiraceae bacterium]|nr:hypothetical protein [Lachnospiraceae bacterium]